VDTSGCVEIKIEKGVKLTLEGILFKTGKAEIDSSSAPTLAHAAEAIKKAPTAKIEIAGFSDNVGNAKKNQALSGKRAEAVKKYLVSLGVSTKQVSSKGYGAAQPIGDNKTEEGRAKNRRIEFRVK
jgi:outer membrane protein OmpA-like peptidoglycan-associated protein